MLHRRHPLRRATEIAAAATAVVAVVVAVAPAASAGGKHHPSTSPSPSVSPSPTSSPTTSPSPSPSSTTSSSPTPTPTATSTVSPTPTTSPTPTPTGLPAGQLLFNSNPNGVNYEIFSMSATGGTPTQLTNDQTYDSWWPRLSPDRLSILFYRTPAGTYDRDYTKTSLWRMRWDGTGLTQLLPVGAYGWVEQGHADWSPDGTKLVMFGGSTSSFQIYVTDASGANPVAVTSGLASAYDPSWSPDGNRVAYVTCPTVPCGAADFEVYTTAAVPGSVPTRVTFDNLRDNDPYYSPDGTRIAWLTETSPTTGAAGAWNIRIAKTDGSAPGYVINDGNVNSKPQWSKDGTLIYFHRLVYTDPAPHFDIYVIHADGTGLQNLTAGQRGSAGFPSV